ncbi:MAG TPA: transglycosylase domain-containing protein [Pedococcus sp.]|nr:transglycosylase domain-containing protein [Pedococcus sp.]
MSTSRPKSRAQAKAAQAGKQKKGGNGKIWGKRLGIAALAAGLLGAIGFFVAYATTDIPQPNDLADAQASIIYYADGKTEMDRISEVNRESVPLSKVPKAVQQAHLAAEDRNFYANSGISPSGIARAVWVGLRGGQTQGGSTITQQYVKNYFLTQDQTLSRKAKEILISVKIAKQKSKDQILEDYLNTIYYGRGAYGIQTASKAYFGKDVSKLTASEGALLASVIRGPSYYDPGMGAEQKKNAEGRVTYVLDGMEKQGWLSQAERSKATFPKVIPYKGRKGASGPAGYLVDAVKKELHAKLKLTDAEIDRGGFKVVTTIDKKAQDAAVAAVKARMPEGAAGKDLHVGLTSIKPGDGAVVAMYGGADFQKTQFNAAVDAKMQAGSTFKIFTLIAALQDQISTKTKYDGSSPQYFNEFKDSTSSDEASSSGKVENFAGEQFGRIDLRKATGHSVNTVFAQLNIAVGPKKTKEAAVAAGLPAKGLNENYANVFGTDTVSVRDMANAYATIAAQGVRTTPYLIRSVKGGPGDLNYKVKIKKQPVFDKDAMADTIDAMTEPIKNGTAEFAQNLGRPAAGKTGTTTDNKSAWFDGYTPQLATAVGIYKGNGTVSMTNLPGFGELTGGTVPVRIWTDYMEAALKGQKVLQFPERAGVGDDKVPTPTPTTTTSSSTSSSSTSTSTTTSSTTTTTTQAPKPTFSKTKKPPRPTLTTQSTATGTPTILGGGGGQTSAP